MTTQSPARPGISACIIARNEERLLGACLSSLRPWVEQICLLDTGSTDGTVAIGQGYGATIGHFTWTNDFSAARNAALHLATSPWIFFVDADETLDPATGSALREAINDPDAFAYFVQREDLLGPGRSTPLSVVRLFRNLPGIRFSRPVHEDVSESLLALGHSARPSAVRLIHRGFLPEEQTGRNTAARNLSILRSWTAQHPDDLYSMWQLAAQLGGAGYGSAQAVERHATFAAAARLADALPQGERTRYPYLPLVYAGQATCLTERGELGRALEVVATGLLAFPDSIDLIFRRGDLLRRGGDRQTAALDLKRCVGAERPSLLYSGDGGARGALPAMGLALLALEHGNHDAAMGMVQQALRHDGENLDVRCLRVRILMMTDPQKARAALDQLTRTAGREPSVQVLAAELAWLQRDRALAMDLWRMLCNSGAEVPPDTASDARAHLMLGELCSGNVEAAAAHWPQLVARDLPSAAAKLIAGVLAGQTVVLDRGFLSLPVLQHVVFWLRELLAVGREDLVQTFARGATRYEARLPGISQLIRND